MSVSGGAGGEAAEDIRSSLLRAYVPRILWGPLSGQESLERASGQSVFGCVCLTDISGFTSLTEQLTRGGDEGAERVQEVLNAWLGRLIDLVDSHGGEVLKFAGDAALSLWPASGAGGLVEASRRGVSCALEIGRTLDNAEVSTGFPLRIRQGLGTGELWVAIVGGVEGRWEQIAYGNPLAQVGRALERAETGEVVASPELGRLLAAVARGVEASDGSILIEGLDGTRPAPAASPPAPVEPPSPAVLRACLPRGLEARLGAGLEGWLAEFRIATVMFVKVLGFEDLGTESLGEMQEAVEAIQRGIYRYGGSLNQVVVDDKGFVALAGWGLVQHAHEDDARRAVLAAAEVRVRLEGVGRRSRFGLATGRVFTGLRGNSDRVDFAMIGSVVNLAARLMEAAEPILCDGETRKGAGEGVEFDELPPLSVKGASTPVEVFRPVPADKGSQARPRLFGRGRQMRRLAEEVKIVDEHGSARTSVIEGDQGIGKSRLTAEFLSSLRQTRFAVLMAKGDSLETASSYHAWRPVLRQILGLEGESDPEAQRRRVVSHLQADERWRKHISLLNPVLGLALPEGELVADMDARSRAQMTRNLIVHLLERYAEDGPVVLVLEDAHWFDSASWAAAEAVRRRVTPLLLLVVTRPLGDRHGAESRRLLDGADCRIELARLDRESTADIVRLALGVESVPEPLEALVWEKTRGHPFYAEELTRAVRDQRLLSLKDGVCEVSPEALDAIVVPDSLRGVVASRLDQLTSEEQLTLKIASVLGQDFELGALAAVHPAGPEAEHLSLQLAAMERLHLIEGAPATTAPAYRFNHAITHEVAYGLLAFAQRRRLHTAVAEWLEQEERSEAVPRDELLAYHWRQAEAPERALPYLARAAAAAVRGYANEEAADFLRQALEIGGTLPESPPAGKAVQVSRWRSISGREAQLCRWRRQLGDAELNLAHFDEGCSELERVLVDLGRPAPGELRTWSPRLAIEILRQIGHRLLGTSGSEQLVEENSLALEVVRSYIRLTGAYYHHNRAAPTVFSMLAAMNTGERAGRSSDLALAYANAGMATGAFGLSRVTEAYLALATATAEQSGDLNRIAQVLGRTGTYRLQAGDWEGLETMRRSMDLSEELGNQFQWEESAYVLALSLTTLGRFEDCRQLAERVIASAVRSGIWIHQVWGLRARAEAELRLGRSQEAVESCSTALALLEDNPGADRNSSIQLRGFHAVSLLRVGETEAAVDAVDRALDEIGEVSFVGYNSAAWFANLAEVHLSLWEEGVGQSAAAAARVCGSLSRHARRHPPARVRSLNYQGWFDWMRGRPAAARRSWLRALRSARKLSMSYEEALALYRLGRYSEPGPKRTRQLEQAAGLFADMGASYRLGQIQRLAPDLDLGEPS